MDLNANHGQNYSLKIGIVGAGFSGTAMAATLQQFAEGQTRPIEIYLFERTGVFGLGEAYKTKWPFHLLNVRARDMSLYDDRPDDFVNWLKTAYANQLHEETDNPIENQFVPRQWYGDYLKMILRQMQLKQSDKVRLHLLSDEVVDMDCQSSQAVLTLKSGNTIRVDKVILALGNNQPASFPFPVTAPAKVINDSWDFNELQQIPTQDPVMVVGTGLSMIDTVLSLYHQQHQGKIYAVSRHGLLPLPHSETAHACELSQDTLPVELRALTQKLRQLSKAHMTAGGDWRSIITAVRAYIPDLWNKISVQCKKRFLRHVLPYWNIHRHRVTTKVLDLVQSLIARQQLSVFAGRVISVENGVAKIRLRHQHRATAVEVKWLVNCMGPAMNDEVNVQPLVKSLLQKGLVTLDALKLGFDVTTSCAVKDAAGNPSACVFTLGPPAKSATWECSAVPDIRKQSYLLAQQLLNG